MFKIFVTVNKHQHFKSFTSQMTSIRLEHSSCNAEWSFVSNFKIADYFFNCGLRCFQLCDGHWIVCNSELHCVAFYLK